MLLGVSRGVGVSCGVKLGFHMYGCGLRYVTTNDYSGNS